MTRWPLFVALMLAVGVLSSSLLNWPSLALALGMAAILAAMILAVGQWTADRRADGAQTNPDDREAGL